MPDAVWTVWSSSGATTTNITVDSFQQWTMNNSSDGWWGTTGSNTITFENCRFVYNSSPQIRYWPEERQLSPDEEAALQARVRQAARRDGIDAAKQLVARRRAETLLRSLLDAREQAELDEHHRVTVVCRRGRRFRVDTRRRAHNIVEIGPDGRELREYCVHAPHDIPLPDSVAAQVLMLRTEPEELERLANVSDLRTGRIVSSSGEPLVLR